MIGSGSENKTATEKRAVVRKVKHPKYNVPKSDYDVGLVEVATPFVVSSPVSSETHRLGQSWRRSGRRRAGRRYRMGNYFGECLLSRKLC